MAGSHPFTKLLCGKCRIQCFQRTKSQDILDSGTLILTVFFFCFFLDLSLMSPPTFLKWHTKKPVLLGFYFNVFNFWTTWDRVFSSLPCSRELNLWPFLIYCRPSNKFRRQYCTTINTWIKAQQSMMLNFKSCLNIHLKVLTIIITRADAIK